MTRLALFCVLAAACSTESPTPAAKGPVGPSDLRALDRSILPFIQQPVTKLSRDLFPNEPYVVTLQPDPAGTYGRVLIDLDRDKKPDEVWVVEDGERIRRMISTADDGVNYDVTLHLENGAWM